MGYRQVVVVDVDRMSDFIPVPGDDLGNFRKLLEIYNTLVTRGRVPCGLLPTVVETVHADAVTAYTFESFQAIPAPGV